MLALDYVGAKKGLQAAFDAAADGETILMADSLLDRAPEEGWQVGKDLLVLIYNPEATGYQEVRLNSSQERWSPRTSETDLPPADKSPPC